MKGFSAQAQTQGWQVSLEKGPDQLLAPAPARRLGSSKERARKAAAAPQRFDPARGDLGEREAG
jgi:hypothetical protein